MAAWPWSVMAVCGAIVLLATGCTPATSARHEPPIEAAALSDEQLRAELDGVLDWTFQHRKLNTRDHAAWQIFHGALAYGKAFRVEHDGQLVSAVEHVLRGGYVKGWTVERGTLLDERAGRYGLRAIVESGSKTGQGHYDQWLAILAQCELPPDTVIRVGSDSYTISDYVRQVQLDVYRNTANEFSWTLIGLTTYLPTNAEWVAGDGSRWSIEKLVEIEASYPIGEGACGGTHRLIGLAMALNRHIGQGGKIEGAWQLAQKRIEEGIQLARRYQNADGSFSTNYLLRGGTSPDLAQRLSTTGHILEFVVIASSDEQLRAPWVRRAATNLCELFEKTKEVPLECGALYHAAHGLVLYRQRLFGPRDYEQLWEVGG